MKGRLLLSICFLSFTLSFSQGYKTVEFSDLQEVLKTSNDTLYVINFWVNWAKECEQEIPYFDELALTYKDKKLKVLLVCIDLEEDLDKWVKPFLKDMKLKSEVWWLNVNDINEVKHRIDPNWTIEVPFTLMRRGSNGERYWRNGKWKQKELNAKVAEVL